MSLKLKIAPRRSDGVRSTISACDDPPGRKFPKRKGSKRKRQSAAAAWRHLDALLDALLRLVIHRPPAPVEVHLQHSKGYSKGYSQGVLEGVLEGYSMGVLEGML